MQKKQESLATLFTDVSSCKIFSGQSVYLVKLTNAKSLRSYTAKVKKFFNRKRKSKFLSAGMGQPVCEVVS
jgi:hypothetical protein